MFDKETNLFSVFKSNLHRSYFNKKKESFKSTDVIEVGISDHHSLIVTVLKSLLLRRNAKTKLYRDYNSFNIDHFKEDFDNNLKKNSVTEYSHFQNIFLEILHKHALIKKRY